MSNESKTITKESFESFLTATDKYIDTLESGIECLEVMLEASEEENDELSWIVEDQDETNNELMACVAGLSRKSKAIIKENDALREDNDDLNIILQSKQDEIDDWHRYAEELEGKLERQSYLNSFKDKEVVMSDTELMVEKTRKKLCFMQFKDMLKKNPNIKNHVAAEELGVTLETIIRLKCLIAA